MKSDNLYIVLISIMLSFVATTSFGQDLIAKQAPLDTHMKKLDTLALRSVIEREEAEAPSSVLYPEWSNKYAHRETALPDSFRINLRGFHMPCESRVVTSNYGARWGRMHKGIDIKVYIGDTIRAAFSGKVRIVRYEAAGYGKYVVIRHNNGLETVYGHMSAWLVEENQAVKAGQPIGLGGNTGRSTGSHLHFETRLCGMAINPTTFFDFVNQDVVADSYLFRKANYRRELASASRNLRNSARQQGASESMDSENTVTHYHKVVAGETLSSIARKRNTTVDQICKMNHISKNVKVRPGQILRYN
jgi:murein DD-endopeptidase MepM/ murein hydrolase activator NlpD